MYKVIDKINNSGLLIKELESTSEIGLDIESSGLDPHIDTLILVQINTGKNIWILDAREIPNRDLTYLMGLIKDSKKKVIGHNLSFDLKFIYHATKELLTECYDTMLAEQIIFSGLNHKFSSYEELVSKYCNEILNKTVRNSFVNFSGRITEEQLVYAALDVKYLFDIKRSQEDVLQNLDQMHILNLESSLVPIFSKMEYDGIYLDKQQWKDNSDKEKLLLEQRGEDLIDHCLKNLPVDKVKTVLDVADLLSIPHKTKRLTEELESLSSNYSYQWVKDNLNLDSHPQMKAVLNNLFGLGVESTNEDTLRRFEHVEVVKLLLAYRESSKRVSTYGDQFIIKHIHPITGRIHTRWNQLVSTGRISSSNPNLQNQPKEASFRSCYKAKDGYLLITADYSQAELRLLGAVSKEPVFIESFLKNEDIHKKSAAGVYGVSIDDVTSEQRKIGKALNFGLNYGITKYGLNRKFGIPMDVGEELVYKYFNTLKYVRLFIDMAGSAVLSKKFSITPFGRKRFFNIPVIFNDIKAEEKYIAAIKREGVNHIIQGGIADAIKLAMLSIFIKNPFGNDLNCLLQVHDELVYEVKEDLVDQAMIFVQKEMQDALQPFLKDIPAVVDISIGKSWGKN